MKTYTKNAEDRIGELTGEKPKYTMPGFRYIGQGFTILKDGTLEADETASESIIAALIEEGLVLPCEDEEPAEEPNTAEQEAETEDAGETAETAENDGDSLTISLPLADHSGTSLRNLISMLYSRGRLISKATGGNFGCTEALSNHLKDDSLAITAESLVRAVEDFEAENGKALTGLSFTDGKVNFTGFPLTEDADKVQAFQQLVCQMNKLAKEQKRTLARAVDESNERYIFRIRLLRLGMAGNGFKTARRVLLSPLSGNAAFKDNAMEERWKENQNAKRDALKAAKAETEVASDEISE